MPLPTIAKPAKRKTVHSVADVRRCVSWPQFLVALGMFVGIIAGAMGWAWHQRDAIWIQRDAALKQMEKRFDDNLREAARMRQRLENKIDTLRDLVAELRRR